MSSQVPSTDGMTRADRLTQMALEFAQRDLEGFNDRLVEVAEGDLSAVREAARRVDGGQGNEAPAAERIAHALLSLAFRSVAIRSKLIS